MYVYHQNDQSVKKIWIEISIRKKKLNKFWAVGWQMGKVIVLPFQCILFQYQIIMILQMGNVLSFLTLLLYWTKLHYILIPVSIIFSIIFSTTWDEFAVSRGWPVPRPSLHPLFAQTMFFSVLDQQNYISTIWESFRVEWLDFCLVQLSVSLRMYDALAWDALGCVGMCFPKSDIHCLFFIVDSIIILDICRHQSWVGNCLGSSSVGIQTAAFLYWEIISSTERLVLEWN